MPPRRKAATAASKKISAAPKPSGATKRATPGRAAKDKSKAPEAEAITAVASKQTKAPAIANTSAKRTRGRPPKQEATTASKATTKATTTNASGKEKAPTRAKAATKTKEPAAATTAQLNVVKRKPGRPRKVDIEPPAQSAKTVGKRKIIEEAEELARPVKKPTYIPEPKPKRRRVAAPPKPKVIKPKVVINKAPSVKLHVYVFGEGTAGELGLGTAKNAIDVKRPRLNPLLQADSVGVVQVAAGGMHVVALTYDNKILTWGVNDQGALGRNTAWEGGYRDIDDDKTESSSDSGDDNGLNPHEATPIAIPAECFPEGIKFVQVAAGDSCSFALTDDGLVYGWGTFRGNTGNFGFTKSIEVQPKPMLIPELKRITKIVCGSNHVMALDDKGHAFVWGSGEQSQLARRVIERTKHESLVPREFGLPKGKVKEIASGAYHSFAIDKNDNVWTWGLNSFGQTGIAPHIPGEREEDRGSYVLKPTKAPNLSGRQIKQIAGGAHHSIGVTATGDCLVWGRVDGYQMGIRVDDIDQMNDDNVIRDARSRPRILVTPTALAGINAVSACAGTDHSIVIDSRGKAYSWGFSGNYQTGQGTNDDIEVMTLIDNTAVRNKQLNWCGAGGQYSVLTAPAEAATRNGGAKLAAPGDGLTNGASNMDAGPSHAITNGISSNEVTTSNTPRNEDIAMTGDEAYVQEHIIIAAEKGTSSGMQRTEEFVSSEVLAEGTPSFIKEMLEHSTPMEDESLIN